MLKGAIIGFGKIAQTNHLPAYRDSLLNERIQIVAAVETDPVNYEKSRQQFPAITFYKSIEELLATEKLDFADITCPPRFHVPMMEKLIKNEVHIICEKPFTLHIRDAENIREKLLHSGLCFMPCHQYKYSPIWKEFKTAVDAIRSNSGLLLQFNVFRMEADPGIGQSRNPWRAAAPENGGGILLDTGIHYLYLLYWMLGIPGKVFARLPRLQHADYKCEDTAIVTLEYNRAIAQINVTWAADKRYNDARLISDKTSLYYEGRNTLVLNGKDGVREITVPDASDKQHYTSLYVNMFNDFADAIEKNEQNVDLIEEAYQSIRIINRCMKSAESGATT